MSRRAKSVVVTGGRGFIGSHVAAALVGRGIDIIVVDQSNVSTPYCTAIPHMFVDKNAFLARIEDSMFMENVECVIHCGACSNTLEASEDYLEFNNTEYSKKLAQACESHGVRFLYASSAATYGNGSRGYCDRERALAPLNAYGRSKHRFDEWMRDGGAHPPQWAGFKFFNVYGPHEEHKGEQASVPYRKYGEVMSRGYLELFRSYRPGYADGAQMRDFVWIKDVISVVLYFFDQRELSGIYNVGTGRARTFYDCALALFSAINQKPDIRFIDMPSALIDQYQYHTLADISSLRGAGYSASFVDIEEGVRSYVHYLQQTADNR